MLIPRFGDLKLKGITVSFVPLLASIASLQLVKENLKHAAVAKGGKVIIMQHRVGLLTEGKPQDDKYTLFRVAIS